jgi:hypothetical protein
MKVGRWQVNASFLLENSECYFVAWQQCVTKRRRDAFLGFAYNWTKQSLLHDT